LSKHIDLDHILVVVLLALVGIDRRLPSNILDPIVQLLVL
jgi:hypothetical protein